MPNYFLLTWNPKKGAWFPTDDSDEEYDETGEVYYYKAMQRIREGKSIDGVWRCQSGKIQTGDIVFMMKLGPSLPHGIVADGVVTRSRYTEEVADGIEYK